MLVKNISGPYLSHHEASECYFFHIRLYSKAALFRQEGQARGESSPSNYILVLECT